jgi:hypothetical protein
LLEPEVSARAAEADVCDTIMYNVNTKKIRLSPCNNKREREHALGDRERSMETRVYVEETLRDVPGKRQIDADK